MRAVVVTQFGGPEVLVVSELPSPEAGPGHAVVSVSVADILFLETMLRSGWGGEYFKMKPPYVPGFGVAGTVRAVGEGVDASWVGRRVASHTQHGGGCAELAVVRADRMIAIPEGLGDREAAALLHDGPTALSLMDAAKIRRDQVVLVMAAAGGLGILLVQLAHAAGARVIGAARGPQKLRVVEEMGADEVVDYSESDWTDRVHQLTDGRGVDVVFDGAGGALGAAAFGLTAPGGQFSAHGAPSGGFASVDLRLAEERGITVRGIQNVQLPDAELRRLTERVLAEAVAGHLRPVIGRTFPLAEAASAHAAIGAREIVGKALLVV